MTASFACLNSASERLVGHGGEGRGDRGLEEVAVAVDLLDGDLGVDARRVVEVLARLGERRRHRLLARDQVAQPLLGRRERALDHQVGGVGQAAAVAVGILRPRPHDVERQDARIDREQQLLAIELVRRRQVSRRRCAATRSAELTRGGDLVRRLPAATDREAARRTCERREASRASAGDDRCPRDRRSPRHATPRRPRGLGGPAPDWNRRPG